MPTSYVRLSAGRETMTDEAQALCFLAGANSIFYGPRLLTTPNPAAERDAVLLERLGHGDVGRIFTRLVSGRSQKGGLKKPPYRFAVRP